MSSNLSLTLPLGITMYSYCNSPLCLCLLLLTILFLLCDLCRYSNIIVGGVLGNTYAWTGARMFLTHSVTIMECSTLYLPKGRYAKPALVQSIAEFINVSCNIISDEYSAVKCLVKRDRKRKAEPRMLVQKALKPQTSFNLLRNNVYGASQHSWLSVAFLSLLRIDKTPEKPSQGEELDQCPFHCWSGQIAPILTWLCHISVSVFKKRTVYFIWSHTE